MTHFYIQLAVNIDSPNNETIEKAFLGDFKEKKFFKNQKCVLFAADFIEDNFYLEENDSQIKFQINRKKGQPISGE